MLEMPKSSLTPIPLAAPPQPAGDVQLLPVNLITQPSSNLCWAACCAMVGDATKRRYPGQYPLLPATVCDVTSAVFQQPCCISSSVSTCNDTCDVIHAYDMCGLNCTAYDGNFEWPAIEDEIGIKRRPIEVYYLWDALDANGNLQGHVALVTGYKLSTEELYVLDPLTKQHGWTRYDDVVSAYTLGCWRQTYYGIGYSLD